jgi:hypothetical protein
MNELKAKYLGKHLLVGLTYLNDDESVREQVQLHGIINKISDNTIVFERADNGNEFSIPFDEENLNHQGGEANQDAFRRSLSAQR